MRWSVNGQFTTQPVVVQGVLYVGNHATASLEARSLATGAVLWSWPLSAVKEERFGGDLIATNKLLFVAGQGHVCAGPGQPKSGLEFPDCRQAGLVAQWRASTSVR